jgi:hypothetical protein
MQQLRLAHRGLRTGYRLSLFGQGLGGTPYVLLHSVELALLGHHFSVECFVDAFKDRGNV